MVNYDNEKEDINLETTNDASVENEEPELADIEETSSDKIKKIRAKLARCEEEKKNILDESQRAKADFLNARRRLDEERVRDRIRSQIGHVEELLPLCDSFEMAMNDKEIWEKADEAWRKGIEGIQSQLNRILSNNNVVEISPQGEPFNPHQHEAVGTEEVTDKNLQDVVISVVQKGYELKMGDKTELIRPARVTTGIVK